MSGDTSSAHSSAQPPFRLLSVNSSLSQGGLERFQLTLACLLAQRGHAVEVVAEPGSWFSSAASEAGLPVHELRFHRYIAPIAVLRLARLFKRRRVDVIHYCLSRNIWTVAPAARLAGMKGRIVHTLEMNPGGQLNNPLHRWLRRSLGAFVTPSPETCRKAASVWGMEPEEVTLIPNLVAAAPFEAEGLDEEAAGMRAGWGISGNALVVGTLARLEPNKGIDLFVEMALQLSEHEAAVPLFFVVGGPVSPGSEQWIEELKTAVATAGRQHTILFTGPQEKVPAFMRALDLFVLPSYRETFGNVLVEAMLAARPIVATQGPGPDFILDGGAAGILVPLRDSGQLSQRVQELLTEPQRRAALAAAGRTRALEHFSDAAVLPTYEALFNKLR